ncbi:hypothetical protein BDFB_015194, partial [Asbolus verrucosus]
MGYRFVITHYCLITNLFLRNRLREANLRPRRPVRKPRLTRYHKEARIRFAREHIEWQLRHWKRVLFT